MFELEDEQFAIEIREFRERARKRAEAILLRHEVDPEEFFVATIPPVDLLEKVRDEFTGSPATVGTGRDDLTVLMGEWLVRQGCGYWAIGPLDLDRDSSSPVIRLGFGIMNPSTGGFSVLVSWAEEIMNGGSAQMAANLLRSEVRQSNGA